MELSENHDEVIELVSVSSAQAEQTRDSNGDETKLDFDSKVEVNRIRRVLNFLGESLSFIKRFFQEQWLLYVRGDSSKTTRAYQFWPGNNVFFFHGRLVCGPDPRGLVLTIVSIFLSSWIFTFYVSDVLPNHSIFILTIFVILTITVLVNLFLVSATDPGIIPRNNEESAEEIGNTNNGSRRKKININGVEVRLKYCRICKIYRPPRSCHCAVCNNCVEKFDHHCPWIGQCIALRNYRFYLPFITSALVFFVYILIFSCWRIHQRIVKDGSGFLGMLGKCPETVALASFSFIASWFLGGLTTYHTYLVAVNQTAFENFRERYVNSLNPHDKGLMSNIEEVFCAPMPIRRVNFRAEVTPSLPADTT
ncbi:hypothetical protein ACFE04_018819 [Oxalis oulophora]